MAKPLDGIRVLDFSHMLSGPLGTYQLHLLGAEVVKVEPIVHGDPMRMGPGARKGRVSPAFAGVNAGKRSVALDLKSGAGREAALALARTADVVVENFRPGVMARLGLGYDSLLAIKPDLIYCSITGYGQDGPMRDWPAYDHVVQAVTGMTMLSGDGSVPVRVGFPLVDAATGMSAATAVTAALLRRARGGGAQYIDVSMMGAASSLLSSMVNAYLGTGEVPRATSNRGFTGSPGAGTFATQSGWVAVGANTPAQFERLCECIGIRNLLDDASLIEQEGRQSGFVRALDDQRVRMLLEAGLATRPAAHWEPALNAAGIPAARIRGVNEFADELLNKTPGATVRLPPAPGYPNGSTGVNVGFTTLHDKPGTDRDSPGLGEHTVQELVRIGIAADKVQQWQAQGGIGVTTTGAAKLAA